MPFLCLPLNFIPHYFCMKDHHHCRDFPADLSCRCNEVSPFEKTRGKQTLLTMRNHPMVPASSTSNPTNKTDERWNYRCRLPLHLVILNHEPAVLTRFPGTVNTNRWSSSIMAFIPENLMAWSSHDLCPKTCLPEKTSCIQYRIAIMPFIISAAAACRNSYTRSTRMAQSRLWQGNSRNLDLNRDFIKQDAGSDDLPSAIFHEPDRMYS